MVVHVLCNMNNKMRNKIIPCQWIIWYISSQTVRAWLSDIIVKQIALIFVCSNKIIILEMHFNL